MPSLRWLTALRIPIWVTVAAIVVSALAGYLALSRFLAQQLIVTGSILAFVYLLLLWVDGFMQGLGDDSAATGRWLKERAGLEQRRREQLVLPIGLFLKFAVLVLSVPLILLQWGYTLARHLRLVHAAVLRLPYRKHASIVCRPARFDHRVRTGLCCRAAVPGLARCASPEAGRDFGRGAGLDPHRAWATSAS